MESNLSSVPQDPDHPAVSNQLGDVIQLQTAGRGTAKSARRRRGKAKNSAVVSNAQPRSEGGGFLSIGGVRIHCDVDWRSESSDAALQEVEGSSDSDINEFSEMGEGVGAFLLEQAVAAGHGGWMEQADAGDSTSSSSDVDTCSSDESSLCLTDSSVDDDLVQDYMINLDEECFSGLLLDTSPLDQVPVEFMSYPVTGESSLFRNPRRMGKKALFQGESSENGELEHLFSLQTALQLEDLDVTSGGGIGFDGGNMATPIYEQKRAAVSSVGKGSSSRGKSKKGKSAPGLKKELRKLRIEAVRKERLIRRGLDLSAINVVMESIVKKKVDMHCFQPMEAGEREQVRRLASLYHLKSGSQGKGRKRFVVVTRTRHTCIPDGELRDRLRQLLAPPHIPGSSRATDSGGRSSGGKSRRQAKEAGVSRSQRKRKSESSKKTAAEPLFFVSGGVMDATSGAVVEVCTPSPVAISETFASFECHTTGFGSKMMAKMGFVKGSGLGKDSTGIASPIEAVRRPKSLGLGSST